MPQVLVASYPATFRVDDTQALGTHIRQHSSVSLIGMKRVGISNFLHFFLNHPQVISQFIDPKQHILVVVDLNSLVERTLYAFWMLLLKRLVDAIEADSFPEPIIQMSQNLFTQSIQLGDLFFTVEAINKLLTAANKEGKSLTIFFLRFDRLKDIITSEFFANIKGLKESGQHVSYVFTSYRPLSEIIPVFSRSAMSGFIHELYLKPASNTDMKNIASAFQKQYDVNFMPAVLDEVMRLSGGHVQYLHLCLIKLKNEVEIKQVSDVERWLAQDEEITYLSEELFTSLTTEEQEMLVANQSQSKYLIDTGFVTSTNPPTIFSPLFAAYLNQFAHTKKMIDHDFSHKEQLLFSLLQAHEGELVEREKIIEAVWPDEVELGVSDWSIDRLVSRLRSKLQLHESKFKILTVITRGYKLIKSATDPISDKSLT